MRYYAALQMSGLDAEMGRLAAPVLRQILAQEKDPDLVDRAKLGLMRCGSGGPERARHRQRQRDRPRVPAAAPRTARTREAHWVARAHHGEGRHQAEGLDQPAAGAGGDALQEPARRRQGRTCGATAIDAETFWARLRELGPSEIISIEGDDGERIQIWTEE